MKSLIFTILALLVFNQNLVAKNETPGLKIEDLKSENPDLPNVWVFEGGDAFPLMPEDFTEEEIQLITTLNKLDLSKDNYIQNDSEEGFFRSKTAEEYMSYTNSLGLKSIGAGTVGMIVTKVNAAKFALTRGAARLFVLSGAFVVGYSTGKKLLVMDREMYNGKYKREIGIIIGSTIDFYSQDDAAERFKEYYIIKGKELKKDFSKHKAIIIDFYGRDDAGERFVEYYKVKYDEFGESWDELTQKLVETFRMPRFP